MIGGIIFLAILFLMFCLTITPFICLAIDINNEWSTNYTGKFYSLLFGVRLEDNKSYRTGFTDEERKRLRKK